MRSKRSLEGYIMIDHRASPGIDESTAQSAALPPGCGVGLFEGPILICSHCQKTLIMNTLRLRSRGYCLKCDKYVCDECELIRVVSGGECNSFVMQMDQILESAIKETLIKEI